MASWAADLAVIVSSLDYLSADGVSGFLEMLKVLQTEKQWRGKLAGILPTFYDEQTRTTREQMANLQSGISGSGLHAHPSRDRAARSLRRRADHLRKRSHQPPCHGIRKICSGFAKLELGGKHVRTKCLSKP
jgi:cellulose biosynthesis protein BcsQ